MTAVALVQPQAPQTLYEQAVRKRLQALLADAPEALKEFRLRALARFEALGFPTRRHEDWKRLNLRPLLNEAFQAHSRSVALSPDELTARLPQAAAGEALVRLVFVNGRFQAALSDLSALPPEVTAGSLRQALADNPEWVLPYLDATLAEETDVFAALNLALFEDGLFLHVPAGQRVAPLIQVVCLTTEDDLPCAAYLHHCLALDSQAEARLMFLNLGLSEQTYLNSIVQALHLAEGAKAECAVLLEEGAQGWNLSASRANLSSGACLDLHTVSLSGANLRHAVRTSLKEENASVYLNGLDVLCGRTNISHPTVTVHDAPNCTSFQFYKGILEDETTSEFNGKVVVAPGALGTDSRQMNKNLLLSENARVWTRPQLQIGADNVKCAHGATVGQLEKEQLFYLASRGLEPELARALLIYGFAEEIIARIGDRGVREYLDGRVLSNLHPDERLLRQLGV